MVDKIEPVRTTTTPVRWEIEQDTKKVVPAQVSVDMRIQPDPGLMRHPGDVITKAPEKTDYELFYPITGNYAPPIPEFSDDERAEVRKILQELVQTLRSKEYPDTFNFDEMYRELLSINAEIETENIAAVQQLLTLSRKHIRAMSEERKQALLKISKRIETSQIFKKAGTILASIGLSAAAMSISTPLGVGVLVISMGLAIDSICDDPAKRAAAELIGKATAYYYGEATAAKVEDRTFFGLCVASTALTLIGSAVGGIAAATTASLGFLGPAVNLLSGVCTGGRAFNDFQKTRDENKSTLLEHGLTETQNNRRNLLDTLNLFTDTFFKAKREEREYIEKRQMASQEIYRMQRS